MDGDDPTATIESKECQQRAPCAFWGRERGKDVRRAAHAPQTRWSSHETGKRGVHRSGEGLGMS
eukprot:scaffold42627_cov23-Tisochrysis_lutea.AAC.1